MKYILIWPNYLGDMLHEKFDTKEMAEHEIKDKEHRVDEFLLVYGKIIEQETKT